MVSFTVQNGKRQTASALSTRFHLFHHGRSDHRLRLHQFWKRHREHAGLCDRKRGESQLRRAARTARTRSRTRFRPRRRERTRLAWKRGGPKLLLAGTTQQQSITYGAPNKVVYFSVDGSPVTPRRDVVAIANCNQCHVALSVHGSLRNNTEYCVMCHNPSNTDASVRVSATVPADKAAPPQGITFPLLVHRIHDGVNMVADGGSYTVVGLRRQSQRFFDDAVSGDVSQRQGDGPGQLLTLSRERFSGKPAHRVKQRSESTGLD